MPSTLDIAQKEVLHLARETKNEDRKQRIRDAFQEGQAVERMPAREDMQPQNSEDVELRVAPYCRVSTMSDSITTPSVLQSIQTGCWFGSMPMREFRRLP